MIDIKPFIARQLEEVGAVELSYSHNFRTLPLIVMTETENEAVVVIENNERVSRITIQIDVYARTAAEVENMALEINGILTLAGFHRSFGESIYDEDKPRKCMRFRCSVDEISGRILTI